MIVHERVRADERPGVLVELAAVLMSRLGDEDLSHMSNWFACMRSGNKKTNATVDNGFLHAVAVARILAQSPESARLGLCRNQRRCRISRQQIAGCSSV